MRTHSTVLAAAAALFASAVAQAQASNPTPAAKAPPAGAPAATAPAMPTTPPKPAAELEAFMKKGEGSWKCESTMPPGAMGPGSPEMKGKSTVKLKKSSDGFYYEGDWEMKKSKEMPMAMKGRFLMGWDAASSHLVSTGFDNLGSYTSTGGPIVGDTATLNGTGTMMGHKMKLREIMTVKADGKEMSHSMEVDMGKGFQNMGTDVCKK